MTCLGTHLIQYQPLVVRDSQNNHLLWKLASLCCSFAWFLESKFHLCSLLWMVQLVPKPVVACSWLICEDMARRCYVVTFHLLLAVTFASISVLSFALDSAVDSALMFSLYQSLVSLVVFQHLHWFFPFLSIRLILLVDLSQILLGNNPMYQLAILLQLASWL